MKSFKKNSIHYISSNQLYVCKCPNCAYPISIPTSEIKEVPNDYLQCSRCNYIFKVSKLDDFHKLSAENFSYEELDYCRGLIPDSQEIVKLVKSINEQKTIDDKLILPKINDNQ